MKNINLHSSEKSENIKLTLNESIQLMTNFLCTGYPQLDTAKVTAHLTRLSVSDIEKLKEASIASLVFDAIFSPGIIPKFAEEKYHRNYADYFQVLYGVNVFDSEGRFIYQDEKIFHEGREGANSERFIREWIANIRAVSIMMATARPEKSAYSMVKTNLAEAAICRQAEIGTLSEDLFNCVPIPDQIRLQEVMKNMDVKKIPSGLMTRIAQELEFSRDEIGRATFERQKIVNKAALAVIEENPPMLSIPPKPVSLDINSYDEAELKILKPKPAQKRFAKLHTVLGDEKELNDFTALILNMPGHQRFNIYRDDKPDKKQD